MLKKDRKYFVYFSHNRQTDKQANAQTDVDKNINARITEMQVINVFEPMCCFHVNHIVRVHNTDSPTIIC